VPHVDYIDALIIYAMMLKKQGNHSASKVGFAIFKMNLKGRIDEADIKKSYS